MKFRIIAFLQENTCSHNRLGLPKLSLRVHFTTTWSELYRW